MPCAAGVGVAALVAATVGCAPSPGGTAGVTSTATTSTSIPQLTPTSTVATATTHLQEVEPAQPRLLDPERRAALGLPPRGQRLATLPPLTEVQWARPEVVAARYVLIDTNYSSDEDPVTVAARRADYAGGRLAAELTSTSSAAVGLEAQRHQGVVFEGEVLALDAFVEGDRATVLVAVRRTRRAGGAAREAPRIGFHQLTLVRDAESGHWLVVDVELS